MPSADYRVTIIFDYSAQWDEDESDPDWEPDIDYLHDAIVDSFDTVDLEFTTNHVMFDEDGNEKDDETKEVDVNCDNVREVDVERSRG